MNWKAYKKAIAAASVVAIATVLVACSSSGQKAKQPLMMRKKLNLEQNIMVVTLCLMAHIFKLDV